MSRPEADNNNALLLVGPQHIDERRPAGSMLRRVLEQADPLGIGIVSAALKERGFNTLLLTMEPGRINDLERYIEHAGVVFISSRHYDTNMARQAAEIAVRSGKKVIMGGYGPTLNPDSFLPFGTIVQGEAEPVLPGLIDDLKSDHLQSVYDSTILPPFDLGKYIWPDRTIYPDPHFGMPKKYPQEWARGCYNRCPFCSPALLQRELRSRDPQDIIAEIESIGIQKGDFLFSVDLNTLSIPREKLIPLFTYLKKNGIKWMTEGTVAPLLADLEQYGKNDSLLSLMSPQDGLGGCYSFLYGADDLTKATVSGSVDKEKTMLAQAVKVFREFGIPLNLSVIVGLDNHTFLDSFFQIADTLEDIRAPYTFFHIATPYPGTVWGDKVSQQSRIIDSDSTHFNHRRVVATPNQMSVEELQQGYYWLQRKLYSPAEIAKTYKANHKYRSPNVVLESFLSGLPFAIETYLSNLELGARGFVDYRILKDLDEGYTRWKSTKHEN